MFALRLFALLLLLSSPVMAAAVAAASSGKVDEDTVEVSDAEKEQAQKAAATPNNDAKKTAEDSIKETTIKTAGALKITEEFKKVLSRDEVLKITDHDIILGDPKAPITILEYASLSCPHCASFHTATLPMLMQQYIDTGKAKLIFRDFPLNAPALRGSQLARCVDKDQFYPMLKLLFENQSKWAFHQNFMQELESHATLAGVSKQAFAACMEDKEMELRIILSKKRAAESLEVASTPSFFINGEMLAGMRDFDEFKATIDPLLQNK